MAHTNLEWAVLKARGLVQSRWQVLPRGRTMVGPWPHSYTGKDTDTLVQTSPALCILLGCALCHFAPSLPVGVSFKPAVPTE